MNYIIKNKYKRLYLKEEDLFTDNPNDSKKFESDDEASKLISSLNRKDLEIIKSIT